MRLRKRIALLAAVLLFAALWWWLPIHLGLPGFASCLFVAGISMLAWLCSPIDRSRT